MALDIVTKANYVIKNITTSCALPWYVYIELAAPAAADMFINYASLGGLELLREAGKVSYTGEFTPASRFGEEGLGKGFIGHGRQGKGRGGKKLKPDAMFGEVVEDESGIKKATKFLWRALAPVERLLFFWFIAELGVDFFYNWVGMVQQCQQCKNFSDAQIMQRHNENYHISLALISDQVATYDTLDQNYAGWPTGEFSTTPPFGKWKVIAIMNCWAPDNDVEGAYIGIQHPFDGKTSVTRSSPVGAYKGATWDMGVTWEGISGPIVGSNFEVVSGSHKGNFLYTGGLFCIQAERYNCQGLVQL